MRRLAYSGLVVLFIFCLSFGVSALGQTRPPSTNPPIVNSYALVVGIDDYENWHGLTRAVGDARSVGEALEKHHGFKVTYKYNLKGDALQSAFQSFFAEKGHDPDTRLLVWFAGHGATVDVRGEKIGYLVPADAPRNPLDPQFQSLALPMERVLFDYAKRANARQVLIIFDSCFAGAALSRGAAGGPAPMQHWNNHVRHFIAAGTSKQSVLDDGLLARLFINAVTGKTKVAHAQQDGYLTSSDLGHFLTAEAGRRNGQEQTPITTPYRHRNHPDETPGEFVFRLGATRNDQASIFNGRSAPSLPEIINSCVTLPRHPRAEAITERLANVANVQDNILDHKAKDQQDTRWQSIPKNVNKVIAQRDGVHLFYPEGGELVVTPVVQETLGFAGETILLQGGWLQLANYGCIEVQFSTATNSGELKWWIKRRNRVLPEVPGWSQLPMRTTLQILPKSKAP